MANSATRLFVPIIITLFTLQLTITAAKSKVNAVTNSQQDLLKSIEKYDPRDELVPTKCNKKLLEIFGLTGDKQSKSSRAKADAQSYCRRNKMSCCSSSNIQSMNPGFAKGATAFRARFEVVEELFSLFRGPAFDDFVSQHADKVECHPHVSDLEVTIEGIKFNFFDEAFSQYHQQMIMNMLMDTENYMKKNLWYYGDVVCTICNPGLQNYFNLNKDGSSMLAHTNTCSEMLEEREFEKNLYIAYEEFLRPVFEFSVCVTKGKEAAVAEDENSLEDAQNSLKPIDTDGVEDFIQTLDECWEDQEVGEEKCVAFCSKSLRSYVFPIPNLMTNYHMILKGIFEAWDDADIDEYYETTKGRAFSSTNQEDPINFFANNENWTNYKFDDLEWSYDSTQGHNLYKEIISKKYLDFAHTGVLSVLAVMVSALALF